VTKPLKPNLETELTPPATTQDDHCELAIGAYIETTYVAVSLPQRDSTIKII
jgi:hypothetical protein